MEYITLGEQLINFQRMLIIVVIGVMTMYFDGGLMGKMGLQRESFWAKVFGGMLIMGGVGAWIACGIFN